MVKTFNVEIDCAVCAIKVEDAIKKIEGVKNCSVNFLTQKMTIDCEDFGKVEKTVLSTARKIEPDFEILG